MKMTTGMLCTKLTLTCVYSSGTQQASDSAINLERKPQMLPPPPPLDLCCMSGCQNCVMVQHAEELLKLYHDDTAARAALEEIPDENFKVFLKMELNLK